MSSLPGRWPTGSAGAGCSSCEGALFTLASALCAIASDIVVLDVTPAVQGTGAAVMFAVSLAVLSVAFPRPEQRMRALGRLRGRRAAPPRPRLTEPR